MTEQEVLAAANKAAAEVGYELTDYRSPEVTERQEGAEWVVFYQGKKMLVGDHFMAVVDDRTGHVRLVPGR